MLKRKAHPDTPYSSLGPRQHRLARASAPHRAGQAQQRVAYAAVDAESNGCCFTCGQWVALDHSHLFPQGMNKQLRANPANIVLECRPCHTLWGEKLADYARRYPVALAAKAERMRRLDRQRWAVWMLKNEHLLATT